MDAKVYGDGCIYLDNVKYGIEEYGSTSGIPVFYFHGFPGCRIEGKLFLMDTIAKEQNLRIIAIDRPGMGLSDFLPHRTLLSWPQTLVSIADYFKLDKFSILGISGGGPYALACAYAIPERLQKVIVVSGMGPFQFSESLKGKAMLIPKQGYWIQKLIAFMMYWGITKRPDKFKINMLKTLPEADQIFFQQPEVLNKLLEIIKEAFKSGTRGFLTEAKIYKSSWGFNLSDIAFPIELWHGNADLNVPIRVAEKISAEIPDCKLIYKNGEGHFSLTGNYILPILSGFK